VTADPVPEPLVVDESAPWQVSIRRDPERAPVGGGLYCPDGHVVTCAHVVDPDGKRPAGPVYVSFKCAPADAPVPAMVVDGGWWPPSDGGLRGDVAVLRLTEPAPAAAAPGPLFRSPEGVSTAHSFYAHGYPKLHSVGGVPARGTIIGQAEFEWISLLADPDGQGLDPGFSGSPVWDVQLAGVVGLIVLRDVPRSSGDRGGTAGGRNAYAIRMEKLGGYWPALQPKVLRALPSEGGSLEKLLDIGLTADGALPTVGETSVYDMGVTPSKYVSAENPRPPYVPRQWVDAEIATLLNAGERFIVAVGDSKSGKSRSLSEMMHRLRPEARLIVPAASDPTALSKLAQRDLSLGPDGAVLWLDDIDRYLVPNGLDHKVLRSVLTSQPPITIAGTITSRRHHDIMTARDGTGTRDAAAQFGQVLSQAKLVRVASKLSAEDLAEARTQYPEEDFSSRGIGQQMVAADMVEQLYGWAREGSPEGWAVIQAAVDWRRIGVSRPVTKPVLYSLFQHYLPEVIQHLEPDEDRFAVGLRWATEPLVGTIALLTTVKPGGDEAAYRAFDYVLACADGQGPFQPEPIASSAWDVAISTLDADELLVITQAAVIQGETEIAKRAAEAARRGSDDPAATARAALFLGELQVASGDQDSAAALLEEAAASGITDVVPTAQADLGQLLSMPGGEPDRARALLESAIAAGDVQVTAQAQLSLGVMLMTQENLAEARPLLEAAMAARVDLADSPFFGLNRLSPADQARLPRKASSADGRRSEGWGAAAPVADDRSRVLQAAAHRRAESVHLLAQVSLGGLLVNEGDLDGAQMLLEAALNSHNPEVEPLARTNLGLLLLRHGDLEAARVELERVVNGGNADLAALAMVTLAGVLLTSGDEAAAYELLEAAAASGSIDHAPRALCVLGGLYADRDDYPNAISYFEQAVETGHRDWAPYARVNIGVLTAYEGDMAAARELLEAVIAADHPQESARAADLLGDQLLARDDVSGAEEAYRRAIGLGHPWWSAVATTDLAQICVRRGDNGEATRLLRTVIDAGDPNAAPMAADRLGDMLRQNGEDLDGAAAAYQEAIDSGHADWSATARFDLADLLYSRDDREGAQAQLRLIIEGQNRIYAAKAWDYLGELLAESGDSASARDAFQHAIDSGVAEWPAVARVDLARLILTESDNVDEAEPLLNSALATGSADAAASARLLLGLIALYRGDRDRAREEFSGAANGPSQVAQPALVQIAKMAMDDGDLNAASSLLEPLTDIGNEGLALYATAHLGVVRIRQGRLGEALDLLERGAASDDPDTAAYAHLNWGLVLFELGEVDSAAEILAVTLDSGQPEVMMSARAGLGMVRVAQGHLEEARTLLTDALENGNPEDEPKVRRYLGSALARLGQRDEARAVLEPLAALDDAEHRPAGLLLLGRLAAQSRDAEGSRRWFTAAIEAGDDGVAAEARLDLGRMLAEAADLEGSREILTPLLDQRGSLQAEAAAILGELTAGENAVPPAQPVRPAPVRPALPPGKPAPAPPASRPSAARTGLAPLPAVVLAGLAEIAEAEGQRAEAEYWRGALVSARAAEASAGGDGADAGDDGGPGASVGPHHDGSRAGPA